MRFVYTDGSSLDFMELCHELDDFLNELVGGEENAICAARRPLVRLPAATRRSPTTTFIKVFR